MYAWLLSSIPWLRALLGLVFLLAAVSKLRDSRGFSAALRALGIERAELQESLRVGVPLAEAVLGIWLWTGWTLLWSAGTAVAAFSLLTLALLKLRRVGYTGTCGCFIGDTAQLNRLPMARNGLLLVLAFWLGLGAYVAATPVGLASAAPGPFPLLVGVATVITVGTYVFVKRRTGIRDGRTTDGPALSGGGRASQPGRKARKSHRSERSLRIAAEHTAAPTDIAPRLELTDLTGARVVLGRPGGAAQLVVFAKGRCPGCCRDRDILNRRGLRPPMLETVIVCGGDLEETKEFASQVKPPIRVVADPHCRAPDMASVARGI